VYPYHSSWSVLYTYLPKWSYAGGRSEILKSVMTSISRRKVVDYLKTQKYNYDNIMVAQAEGNAGFVGKTLTEIADSNQTSQEEALLNVLVACGTQAVVFDQNLSDAQVDHFLESPLGIIATDGAGYTGKAFNYVHPRCFGTMARYLKWVKEKKKITLEEAIRKITSEPARLLGFKDRGSITKGAVADVVVFDENKISDKATYAQPYQLSEGIHSVVLNGKVAFENNEQQGLFGAVVRRT
jgi:N-acyl-D-amino-acid deacylase